MTSVPTPTAEQLVHSQQLQQQIKQYIRQQPNQWISFAEFMHMALYQPGFGYYVAGMKKFGVAGDFVTAPEISPLFSQCVANQCDQVLTHLNQDNPESAILEFGAGSGVMAVDILLRLEQLGQLPSRYYIVEVSPDLAERQRQLITSRIGHLVDKVVWLSQFPKNFTGIVLANEVLDAMPVHLFTIAQEQAVELGVVLQEDQFVLQQNKQQDLSEYVPNLSSLPEGYCSELCLALHSWLKDLYQAIDQGVVLILDYGFPAQEYYHPQRDQGTLMCHYRHYAHADFFQYIGLQDITAHVNFSAVAQAATALGFELSGYTTQADFLLPLGLLDLPDPDATVELQYQHAQAIKQLLLPTEMGELFKVMALTKTKSLTCPLQGFSEVDRRHRL